MNYYFYIVAVLVCIIAYLVVLIQQNYQLINEQDQLINDPNFNKRQFMLAFQEAESWRKAKVDEIYNNVSDDELDHAVRWIKYADPFAKHRSCLSTASEWSRSVNLERLWENMQVITSPSFFWNDSCRRGMLTLHSYHTTGIEGNTLTLSETMLVIDNKPLLAGFSDEEKMMTPITSSSLNEVRNIKLILDALKFSSPPTPSNDDMVEFSKQLLVDINSAILGSPSSFREHPVAVGHQKIVLPMPDEVNHLINLYIDWINTKMRSLLSKMDESSPEDILVEALSLACDAHTKFVHIHPFSDGNGRLARILSGLVLRRMFLPAPLFLKEGRHEYISAVGANTILGDPRAICTMHAEAVQRSMDAIIQLSKNDCIIA